MPKKGRKRNCKNNNCLNLVSTKLPFPLCLQCNETLDYKCLLCRVEDIGPKYPICGICRSIIIKDYQCYFCKLSDDVLKMCYDCDMNGYDTALNNYYTF